MPSIWFGSIRFITIVVLCLWHWSASELRSETGAKGQPSVDALGDPLPDGAIARVGTSRFSHPGGIPAIAMSPQGDFVATGNTGDQFFQSKNSPPASIRIWETRTGKLRHEIKVPWDNLNCLAFSPDGKKLAGGGHHVVGLWDVASGQQCWQRDVDKNTQVNEMHFTGDGRLISVHSNRLVRIWHAASGKLLRHHKVPGKSVYCVSPDERWQIHLIHEKLLKTRSVVEKHNAITTKGKRFVYESVVTRFHYHTTSLRLEIIESGKQKRRIDLPFQGIKVDQPSLQFSPDSRTLLALLGKTVFLVDLRTKNPSPQKRTLSSTVVNVHFTPDGKILTFIDGKENLELWDLRANKKVACGPAAWDPSNGFAGVAANRDGTLFVGKSLYTFRVWNAKTRRFTPDLPGHAYLAEWHFLSKRHLLTVGTSICLWDTGNWKHVIRITLPAAFRRADPKITSYRNNAYLDTASKNAICWRRITDGQVIRKAAGLSANADRDLFCVLSPNEKRICMIQSTFPNLRLQFYDVAENKKLGHTTFAGHQLWHMPDTVHFSPRGRYLICQTPVRGLPLLDTLTGKELHRLGKPQKFAKGEFARAQLIAFSADGRFVAAVRNGSYTFQGTTSTFRIWDTSTGQEVQRFVLSGNNQYERPDIFKMTLSPDGRYVAYTLRGDQHVYVREVVSGQERARIKTGYQWAYKVGFSPDGSALLTTGQDSAILVWDMQRPLTGGPHSKKRLTKPELQTHWQTLANKAAKPADKARWAMIHAPEDSLPLLQQHLQPAPTITKAQLAAWLRALDNKRFRTRQQALKKLTNAGMAAIPAVCAALKKQNPLEVHLRLQSLLPKLSQLAATPKQLQELRALEIVEKIGSPAAEQLLERLAKGTSRSRFTQEAHAALQRLRHARVAEPKRHPYHNVLAH